MVKREQYAVAGLLGVVALVFLWHLSRQKLASGTVETPTGPAVASNDPASGLPSYPNVPSGIKLGDIILGGSPLNISYNQMPGGQNSLPTIRLSNPPKLVSPLGAPSCCKDCDDAGPSNVITISEAQIESGAAAIKGFRWGTLPGASAPLSDGMRVN